MMHFTELHRHFVRVDTDKEESLSIGLHFGRKTGRWLDWDALLEFQRVVLLAEADSGKTSEFRAQARRLTERGKAAFFARIEDLPEGLSIALEGDTAPERFDTWKEDGEELGWFFLDSVDEARLTQVRFDKALRRFRRETGPHLERVNVFVSCRVSDWKGRSDRDQINEILPAKMRAVRDRGEDEQKDPLLDPVFKERNATYPRVSGSKEQDTHELLTVRLVPLDNAQRKELARYEGVEDPDAFIGAIQRSGLASLSDRPGDIIALAGYWKDHGRRFASLSEMTEYSVTVKLAEENEERADSGELSPEEAFRGAERIATALTFGKSLSLRSGDVDPAFASGAIDVRDVLPDWTPAKRATLLRRGLFAPATYGRVRFHHRGTQEYLTARWLKRMIDAGCPASEIRRLLFAEPYGVETVLPSLRAAAAWLVQFDPSFAHDIVRREPLVLIQEGDPGSLALSLRVSIIEAFATRHARGEIGNDRVEHLQMALFADPSLGSAIRCAWDKNDRTSFRQDLLELIEAGSIEDCIDLARSAALDETSDEVSRIFAIRALFSCSDQTGLAEAAEWLKRAPAPGEQLACNWAFELFPAHLAVAELIGVMRRSQPTQSYTSGFGYLLTEFWARCPDDLTRVHLCEGLGTLCLERPFKHDHERISKHSAKLTHRVHKLARLAVERLRHRADAHRLVPLLMACERIIERDSFDDEEAQTAVPLPALVSQVPGLKQALFWADVHEVRRNEAKIEAIRVRDILLAGEPIWELDQADRIWLEDAVRERDLEADRRIALHAIVMLMWKERLESSGPAEFSEEQKADLRHLVEIGKGGTDLLADLETYLSPSPSRTEKTDWEIRSEARREKQRRKEATAKEGWRTLRDRLNANPSILTNADELVGWGRSAQDMWCLTKWLESRSNSVALSAALEWRLLEEGFGRVVAEAYRDGISMLWRLIDPVAPVYGAGGHVTTNRPSVLAFAGISVAAQEDPEWAAKLSEPEVGQVLKHLQRTDGGYPVWFEQFAAARPEKALPVFQAMVTAEWSTTNRIGWPVFWTYGASDGIIPASFTTILLDVMLSEQPGTHDVAKLGIGIISKGGLNAETLNRLRSVAIHRFNAACGEGDLEWALHHLAFLLQVAPDDGIETLLGWLDAEGREPFEQGDPPQAVMVPIGKEEAGRKRCLTKAERILGSLFSQHSDRFYCQKALKEGPVASLSALVHTAYRFVRRDDDVVHQGGYSPDARDNAEEARGAVLTALTNRKSSEAYAAVRGLIDDPNMGLSTKRLAEIAHSMAERDAERPPWKAEDVLFLERTKAAPGKTGPELYAIVCGALAEIASDLRGERSDAFPRKMVASASHEEEVQKWLVHELKRHAKNRYYAYREAEIAKGDKPDIITSSTSASLEVAVEVKHANKGWSITELEVALTDQLARRYLKPDNRRHGVLVISLHQARTWRDRATNASVTFEELIGRLNALASTLTENDNGPITVSVIGLDATEERLA
ncbi:hypothetical protein CLD20_19660 [Afifella sp. IM 167]|nr:hypothetical protein [Afifella sp. IM 167]